MKTILTLVFSGLAAAGCPKAPKNGVWKVEHGDVFADALYPLGIRNAAKVTSLNRGMNIDSIYPGEVYTVPYTSDLSSPATWSTSACTPVLHLDGATSSTTAVSGATSPAGTNAKSVAERSGPSATHSPPKAASKSRDSTGTNSPSNHAQATPVSSEGTAEYSKRFCRKDGKYFTDNSTQIKHSHEFCDENKERVFYANSDPVTSLYQREQEEVYQYSVFWAKGCTLATEQGLEGCEEIMIDNYEACDNGGKGGGLRKKCLVFEYRSNRLSD